MDEFVSSVSSVGETGEIERDVSLALDLRVRREVMDDVSLGSSQVPLLPHELSADDLMRERERVRQRIRRANATPSERQAERASLAQQRNLRLSQETASEREERLAGVRARVSALRERESEEARSYQRSAELQRHQRRNFTRASELSSLAFL